MTSYSVLVTGGTGYIGLPLLRALAERGHSVRALVRTGSKKKLPTGCEPINGNALDASFYADRVAPSHTFVQLAGVAHPSPSKSTEFHTIDRPWALGAIAVAKKAGFNISSISAWRSQRPR